jgi:cardiolipin synthase
METLRWKDDLFYKEGHSVQWMRGGAPFFDHLATLIRNAEKSVHLQVYLIDSDLTGKKILHELIAAAGRGVEVHLVVDGFGAGALKEEDEQKLTVAGVNFKRFEPYIASGKYYVGRRMHHKIMVVDEKIAMVGGMNIADRYHGSPATPAWIDYAVLVEGPVCRDLTEVCRKIISRQFVAPTPKWPRIMAKSGTLDTESVWVRVRKNDWLRNKREITQSYNTAARLATKTITIVGGYFIPGRRYRRILAAASKRGVEIRIILTHKSDVPVVKYASDYLYGWMLKNRIRIFEASHAMVHGKVAIVDETWSTIGSYNQNHLSAYFSIELNLDIVNKEFSSGFHRHLLEVIDRECTEVTEETFLRNSSLWAKFRRWSAYQIVRLSLRMMFMVNRVFGVND